MTSINDLIQGYRTFRNGTYHQNEAHYRALAARRQKPKAMIIACCDSRADPSMIFSADPGELFVVRNVANLVPPYEPDSHYHGTSAAVEFGIASLNIGDLIVMGHASCGGIEALYEEGCGHAPKGEFIGGWISLAKSVSEQVRKDNPELEREKMLRLMEQGAVLKSLEMLRTFPFIREGEAAGTLRLHGWFYGIGSGILSIYNPATNRFENVPDA
jgi:carbonic anhydrase